MMVFGALGNCGSSSPTSNLSALAPPFSVDRSNSKPNANPLVDFSEPPYALPFQSSFPNWQYSHHPSASRPDFYPNRGSEVDSIRTTSLPSSNTPNPNFTAALNPNFSALSESFTFLQYSSEKPSKDVGDNTYYPPFVSPVIDDDVPLVALNESSYDLLSTSRARLDGPVQVDYSDLEYMPQWDSSWNRLSDLEQGKRVGLDGSFCSEEKKNIAGSYVFQNYIKQDASAVSSRKYADVFGSESQTAASSKGKLHDEVPNPWFISGDSSRTAISGSSILPKSHGQGPFPKPAANLWNHQISYNASYNKCFQPLESCTNDFLSAKKPAPPLVIRPPPSIGTSSTVLNAVSSEDEKNIGDVLVISRKSFDFHDSSNQKEPRLHVQRPDHFFVASSSTVKQETEIKTVSKDVVDYASDSGIGFLPDKNVRDGFTLEIDSAKKAFTSVEDSQDSVDPCNPSVDSPCWKGAPAPGFSLPEIFEACNNLNFQETQTTPPSTCDTVKAYEANGYVELGSLLCPEKTSNTDCPVGEHSSGDEAKAGFNTPILCSNNGVQFSNDADKLKTGYGFSNDSISYRDSKPGHTKELGLEKCEATSETDFKLYAGLNSSDASVDGSVSVHGLENTSCLPYSAENENKLAKVDAMESTPKMNVKMMVNTIHNLSELLQFYWSNDASAVSEKDHESIKQAINNLDACVSKKIPCMTPARESRFPQQGTSREPSLRVGVTEARSPVTKEVNASPNARSEHHHIYEGNSNTNFSGKKVEKCADFVSLRDDADSTKDDKMVQAIKELLKEDFTGDKEMQSETLLYKDLWLEAEAALCSITYRARFNRMKIEMEKCKSDNVKDVGTLEVAEKSPSSKVSRELNVTQKVTSEAKDNPMSDISIQDVSVSTVTKSVSDPEASVMARLDILKRRGQSSNHANAEEQQLTQLVDVGFADKINHFPFVGDRYEAGSFNASEEFHSLNSSSNSKMDEFGPYIGSSYTGSSEDHVIGSGRKKRMGSRILSGYGDSSSSDWEHVMKDEFAGQN